MYYKSLICSTSTKLAEKYTITATIHFRFVIGNFSEKRPTPLLSSRPKAIREEWNVRRDILFSIKTYLQSKKSNSFTEIGQKKAFSKAYTYVISRIPFIHDFPHLFREMAHNSKEAQLQVKKSIAGDLSSLITSWFLP